MRLKERILLLDEINRLGKKTKEESKQGVKQEAAQTAHNHPKPPKPKWRKLAPSPELVVSQMQIFPQENSDL